MNTQEFYLRASFPSWKKAASTALRTLGADPHCRRAFKESAHLQGLMKPAASRYLLGDNRYDAAALLRFYSRMGYRTGIEYVGENISDPVEIARVVDEQLGLLEIISVDMGDIELNFDLTAMGLVNSIQMATTNLTSIASAAARFNIRIMISMEGSSLTDAIMSVFDEAAQKYENIGITVQAYLHRTADDLPRLLKKNRKIRLVKGVYQEPELIALPRGERLNVAFCDYLRMIRAEGVLYSCATHDRVLITEAIGSGLIQEKGEIEMLHGVIPDQLKYLKDCGVPCRIYGTYGYNWFLHLLHRLAEEPDNIVLALSDIASTFSAKAEARY